VDVSNTSVPYSIPPDNPFADGVGGRPEIYAYGLRNPWRCSVDRGNANGVGAGRIFCGDVGQGRFEEIDIIEKGGNYGWRAYEGFACYDRRLCTNATDPGVLYWYCCIHPAHHGWKCFTVYLYHLVIPPIHAYPHRIGRSVTGGYVYRGSCFPRLYGKYIFADYERGRLFALSETTSGEWTSEDICLGSQDDCHNGLVGHSFGLILSFAEDPDGELYVLVTTNVSNRSPSGSLILLVDPNERSKGGKCNISVTD
jgi:hypothetical protein